ncbi:MAG: N-acetylmuramoyl-L-alanine amidase [Ruminococcaceae bacterium]|nr:N-acetylmuramoyl-L-alanine amidase [Oscillospiraceae bacterium]
MSRGLIILDAGHGQFGNPYPVIEGVYEGTRNFVLAGYLKAELEALGFEVMLTRNAITEDPSLEERGRMAGDNGAVLFLSLHSNAPGSATPPEKYKDIKGVLVIYSLSDEERNLPIALAFGDAVAACMDTQNRGAITRTYPDQPGIDYYGVLRHSVASGCNCAFIIEHGFHTNPDDAAFLNSDACMAKLAKVEAEVINRVFSV